MRLLPTSSTRTRSLAALAAATLAVSLAACGGSDKPKDTSSATSGTINWRG